MYISSLLTLIDTGLLETLLSLVVAPARSGGRGGAGAAHRTAEDTWWGERGDLATGPFYMYI
jgi:hypothetical protein